MTHDEATHHLDRCMKSGLLILHAKDTESDGGEETKNNEEQVAEDMEK
jgi:hypothetical protein